MGGHHLIARDFEGPDKEDDEVKDELAARKRRRIIQLQKWIRVFKFSSSLTKNEDVETQTTTLPEEEKETKETYNLKSTAQDKSPQVEEVICEVSSPGHHRKHVSFNPLVRTTTFSGDVSEKPILSRATSTYAGHDAMSPTPTMIAPTERDFDSKDVKPTNRPNEEPSFVSKNPPSLPLRAYSVFLSLLSPATISMLLAFPIALVTPLKGLFVNLDNSPIPNAPDGHPPLYFIMDTANFLGAASIPLGLVCLGAALAKLKMPKTWSKLPLGAIGWMAVGKLVISPILGVLIVNGFVKIGFIREEDKVLRFVTMYADYYPGIWGI